MSACVCKFTLQMRQIWLWVKFYQPITSYFLKYFWSYLPLIHYDWQSSRATQPNTTALACSQILPLACLKVATEAFLTVRAICLNLVEQGRQSWLQLTWLLCLLSCFPSFSHDHNPWVMALRAPGLFIYLCPNRLPLYLLGKAF